MRVGVLGGGLLGCCVALELAERGHSVDLYERANEFVTGASLHNEGKIHLGYVYGNDPSLRTARMMARGATMFSPLLRRWIGSEIDRVAVSTPFIYVAHRRSMLKTEQTGAFLGKAHELVTALLNGRRPDYFGRALQAPPRQIQDLS